MSECSAGDEFATILSTLGFTKIMIRNNYREVAITYTTSINCLNN